jgi:hypothetical protein
VKAGFGFAPQLAETIALMNPDVSERFVLLAARWNLQALRQELIEALADIEEPQRPYVPSQLVRALDMFVDSYGPTGTRG